MATSALALCHYAGADGDGTQVESVSGAANSSGNAGETNATRRAVVLMFGRSKISRTLGFVLDLLRPRVDRAVEAYISKDEHARNLMRLRWTRTGCEV
jgi:hypothetical protein